MAAEVVAADGSHVAYLLVFEGRPPHYPGWVEVYGVDWSRRREAVAVVEEAAASLGPGERIYVEYVGEPELERELQYRDPEDTWLGRLLLGLGLTGLRDLYYPEGFLEGGPKVKAERPARRAQPS